MLQNTELTEYWSAVARREVPERARRVEVVDALAVGDAVARIEERRVGRVAVRLERGGERHDLERRARRVEPLRGAVHERRGGAALGGDRADLAEAVLDEVRVVARRGRHHEQLPAARIEGGDGAAGAAELLERDPLGAEVERRDDGVADDRLAPRARRAAARRGPRARGRCRSAMPLSDFSRPARLREMVE